MIERPAAFSVSAPTALMATSKQLADAPRPIITAISQAMAGAAANPGSISNNPSPEYQAARRAP